MSRKPKTALVLGLGASGRAAAEMLAREGVKVTCVDSASGGKPASAALSLGELGVETLLGVGELPRRKFDVCIVSPGIGADSDWFRSALDSGSEVISELELGYRRCKSDIIAVTGSNGKSTMVKLCHDVLTEAGMQAAIAGNYGTPLCDVLLSGFTGGWIVLEVSSFQLEAVSRFRPGIGVLMNIQPNHLDRHRDMATYARLKARLFDQMRSGQSGIVLDTDKDGVRAMSGGSCKWVSFGRSDDADYRFSDGIVTRRNQAGSCRECSVKGTYFDNDITGCTAAAAAAVMDVCGVNLDCLASVAREFAGLPHRTQHVGSKGGISFIDDSKATSLSAMRASLLMTDRPVHLIAGGLPKNEDWNLVKEVLARKVKAAYLIGKAANDMKEAWSGTVSCEVCGTLGRAVEEAWAHSVSGDVILLAPGCASFDQFAGYSDRGREFVRLTQELEEHRT